MKFELDRLKLATIYVSRMAEGKNPVKNVPLKEGEPLNDPNIIRCMYFVRDVLMAVTESKGIVEPEKANANKEPFKPYPFEVLENFKYKEDKSITHLLEQFMALAKDKEVRQINYRPVIAWLKEYGYLYEQKNPDGSRATLPTKLGNSINIYTEHRKSFRGEEYEIVMYGEQAQLFVAKYFKAMVLGEPGPKPEPEPAAEPEPAVEAESTAEAEPVAEVAPTAETESVAEDVAEEAPEETLEEPVEE